MEIGAVAHVGEHMRFVGEGRLAQPHHAFAAHVRHGAGLLGVQQHGDGVAANARQRTRAVHHLGGAVVRAARTEAGVALRLRWLRAGQRDGRQAAGRVQLAQQIGQHLGHDQRRQLGIVGEHPRRRAAIGGSAGAFANDLRGFWQAQVVEDGFDLVFEHGALFFHHQQQRSVLRRFADEFRVQRPQHADFGNAYAHVGQLCVVPSHFHDGLQNVLVGLACGHDGQARLGRRMGDAVQAVGPRIGHHGAKFVVVKPVFADQGHVEGADIQAGRAKRVGRWQ